MKESRRRTKEGFFLEVVIQRSSSVAQVQFGGRPFFDD